MLSSAPCRRLRGAKAVPARFLSGSCSCACTHAQRLRSTIAREGRVIRTTSRRSLSENVTGGFVVIQHHQALCSRLYSTHPPSSSSDSTASQVQDSPPEPDEDAVNESPSQDQVDEEAEWFGLLENWSVPDMLTLKVDIETLPPLPPIKNDAIRTQAFTHRSVYGRSRHDFEDHPLDPAPDFEVLEFQGDAVLGLIITDLIRDCYPGLRVGPATKLKGMVVANANLADISVKYGLPRSLRVNKSNAMPLKASVHVQADMFEAYIGGLYRDQGLEAVRSWINTLLLPYVKEAYRVCRDQHGLPSPPPSPSLPSAPDVPPSSPTSSDPASSPTPPIQNPQAAQNGVGHLSLFNQILQQKHMTIEWVFEEVKDEGTKVTPIWAVHALVDGRQLAVGRAPTKKGAQNEAAREGLVQLGVTNPWIILSENGRPMWIQIDTSTPPWPWENARALFSLRVSEPKSSLCMSVKN